MKVGFSPEARADLAGIEAYIRPRSSRSVGFVRELVGACEAIGNVPFGFPVMQLLATSELRRKVHKQYLIIYTVKPQSIQIVRVLHGAQNLDRILFSDEP